MTAIIAAHRQGDKTDYYVARDLISVSLGLNQMASTKPGAVYREDNAVLCLRALDFRHWLVLPAD